jgi:hypothetical protein
MANNVNRFVIWICSKFSRDQIEQIIKELSAILNNKESLIKPKDSFKEDHPNYRNFSVDPIAPATQDPKINLKKKTSKNC